MYDDLGKLWTLNFGTRRRTPIRAARWSRCFIALFALGCGDSHGTGATRLPDVPETEFTATYARAICEPLRECCNAASTHLNEPACISAFMHDAESIIRVRGEQTVYDGGRARDCVEAIRVIASGCVTSPSIENAITLTCKTVRVGKVQPGGSCTDYAECAPLPQAMVRCIGAQSNSTEKTCVVDRLAREGEHCLASGPTDPNIPFSEYHALCEDNLLCSDENLCVAALLDGATCRSTRECLKGSWCRPPVVNAPQPAMSICEPQVALGGACKFNNQQCTSGSCYQQTCATGEPLAPKLCGP